jgi:hypothetical protein
MRLSLNLSIRSVEKYSRRIARLNGNPASVISRASLGKAERSGNESPNIDWLISLAVIYKTKFNELLETLDRNLGDITEFDKQVQLPNTTLAAVDHHSGTRKISFPLEFVPEPDIRRTTVLSHLVDRWGEIPLAAIQHMGSGKYLYGYIGLDDVTLDPFIPPGSFVQIDNHDTRIRVSGWKSDFDRPIYCLQHRGGYTCGWCEVADRILTVVPFSHTRQITQRFRFPDEVDVIGRVRAVILVLAP